MQNSQNFWVSQYTEKGALWIHDGKSARPHALLTSGEHSNGFFNSRLIISDEDLLNEAAIDLILKLKGQNFDFASIEGVIGPQTGATKLAELLSKNIESMTKFPCYYASPKKKESDGVRIMEFLENEFMLVHDNCFLLCEDVVTTGGSINLTEEAIIKLGGKAMPFVLTLVNRSGLGGGGKKILSLIDHDMPKWHKDECPLCKEGSVAIPPKGENWAILTQEYALN